MRLAEMRPNIRHASPFDIPTIIELLKDYRAEMPYGFLSDADDKQYVTQMLTNLIAGQGIVLLAETDEIEGMLIAGVMPSLWSPKHFFLTEFAYFVKPQCRNGTSAHRLFARYLDEAVKMKEEGRVTNFFISKMVNSPNLDYGRYGFQKLEEFWVI